MHDDVSGSSNPGPPEGDDGPPARGTQDPGSHGTTPATGSANPGPSGEGEESGEGSQNPGPEE